MRSSLLDSSEARHPVLPDKASRMAPGRVRTPDIAWSEAIGTALQRAVALVGWSNKEAAAKVGVDDAEFGKWLSGGRRPQLDRLFAVAELRQPLIVALAELAGEGVEVQTVVTIRRTA